MEIGDEETKRVAMALAQAERWSPTGGCVVAPGFTVPIWVLYVSEARKLILGRDALKAK